MALRPESGSVPDQPGSYQFKDAGGRIIYVCLLYTSDAADE